MRRHSIRGADLTWVDSGHGTPVMWIHGFPLAGAIFQHQLAVDGIRHIVPDLRGFGGSAAPPRRFTIEDYALDSLALLDHLEVPMAVVAGLSMGGYVALALHRIAPSRMKGLILVDTRETADTDEGRKARFDSIAEVEKAGTGPLIEKMLPQLLVAPSPEVTSTVESIMRSASVAGVVAALQAMAGRPDSSDVLSSIEVPTLVLVGVNDPITPPAVARHLAASIRGARLVEIARAGHLTPIEAPHLFNRVIAEFTSEHFGRSVS